MNDDFSFALYGPAPDECKPPAMTLREYYAGQALAGIISNPNNKFQVTYLQMGEDALKFADALIAALEAPNDK